jgi:hypothetical protein
VGGNNAAAAGHQQRCRLPVLPVMLQLLPGYVTASSSARCLLLCRGPSSMKLYTTTGDQPLSTMNAFCACRLFAPRHRYGGNLGMHVWCSAPRGCTLFMSMLRMFLLHCVFDARSVIAVA